MSRSGDHETQNKARREATKAHRRKGKEARRRERKRDKAVTEKYGKRGHRSCGRKVRYATEICALRAALAAMRRDAPPLWVYRCEMCKGWHLTSHPDPGTGDFFKRREGE